MRALGSLLLVTAISAIAACGDDGNVRHVPDANPDAPEVPPDTSTQPVTLTVTRSGAPQEGVVVYFLDGDSNLVKEAMTDATGTAGTMMAAGGSVTAIDPFGNQQPGGIASNQLFTWLAVEPGDHLVLDDLARAGLQFTVTAPLDTANPSATTYQFYASCGNDTGGDILTAAGTTASGTITRFGCGPTADVLVTSSDVSGQLLGYIYKAGVAVVDQGAIDLTTESYVAGTDRTYTWTNASGDSFLDGEQLVGSADGLMWQDGFSVPTSDPTATLAVPGFTGATSLVSTLQHAPAGLSNRREIVWGPLDATFSSDWDANLLPELTQVPTADVNARAITWTESGGAQQVDFTLLAFDAQREVPARAWQWVVTAPHAAAEVKLPVLPTDIFDFNLATDDSAFVEFVALAKVPGGYDVARPVIFNTYGPEDLAVGASGMLATTELAAAARTAPPSGKLPQAPTAPWRTRR